MGPAETATLIALVRASPLPHKQVLNQLGLPKSTYYDWCRRGGRRTLALEDRPSRARPPRDRLRPEEVQAVLALARASPELSPRELALRITDASAFSVSESSCYRLLKRHGLVKPAEVLGFAAQKEYYRKTSRPNQMWASDGAYLKVPGWGYYYLVTVLDDYSRFILAWRLQLDMTAGSLIEVVQDAVEKRGITEVPLSDRTALLSDNGPGYLAHTFAAYLRLLGIRHIVSAPYHPQTQRQDRALPPHPQKTGQARRLRDARGAGASPRRLRPVLQLPPLPRGHRQRHPRRCLLRPPGRDPGQKKRGHRHDPTATTGLQSGQPGVRDDPQGVH